MPDTLKDWLDLVDECYPMRDAEDWDAVGLHVGDPHDQVRRVLVAHDVTQAVLDEAVAEGADLVLAYHPLIFRPLARLTPDTPSGALALRAARERIAVLAAHTSLDAAMPGTSDPIMHALDIADVRPLRPTPAESKAKLVVFVPRESTGGVLEAVSAAGAGVIGEYDQCSFRVSGTGTFRPSSKANPTAGARGELNQVAEDRLEVLVPQSLLRTVVEAMVAAHPYEEVAYDVVPLLDVAGDSAKGMGRIGRLPQPLRLRDIADRLAAALPSPHARLAGDPDLEVSVVAACAGAGESLLEDALRAGAEVFVTGDLRHHVALAAVARGLALIDAGHAATEARALPLAMEYLADRARHHGLSAGLLASRVRTEPWADYRPSTPAIDERDDSS